MDLVTPLLGEPPYGAPQADKAPRFATGLRQLCRHHYDACPGYRALIDRVFGGARALEFDDVAAAPWLPVSIFKDASLQSVPDDAVVQTLTSSGTTGARVSRVALDAETAGRQSRVLVHLARHVLGDQRRPMVLVDHRPTGGGALSARGAGLLGLAQLGHRPHFALDEAMALDLDALRAYLDRAAGRPVIFFGFTFMVWRYLIEALERRGERLEAGGVLVHSGGWKKLQAEAVDRETFARRARAALGVDRVVDFYGMAEQVGGVFFENDAGWLQASNFSEVIVRCPTTLRPLPPGEPGLLQVLSLLPTSYPGHSLLTEDIGVLRGHDRVDGLGGACFEVLGRAPRAEVRGCSDTFRPSKGEA